MFYLWDFNAMKKLVLAITALTFGLSIIPVHGAERKRKAESESLEAPAAKKQKLELSATLGLAVVKNNVEEVINILEQGAHPNTMTYSDPWDKKQTINPIKYLIEGAPQSPDYILPNGMRAGDAQTAITIALIEHGLNVNESPNGIPLLARSSYSGNTSITQTLIDFNADVNQPIHAIREHLGSGIRVGMTPLMITIVGHGTVAQKIEIIKLLLANGANPFLVDSENHDMEYYLNRAHSLFFGTEKQKQEILSIIEPYKKAYRNAIQEAGEDYLIKDILNISADYVIGEALKTTPEEKGQTPQMNMEH
jgi:Ankyrin repeat